MAIGEKLKNLRLSARRTLKQQSEVFGVSLNSIYRWEHELAKPKKSFLKQMAEFYGVAYEWLTDDGAGEELFERPCVRYLETGVEQRLLKMFRQLPDTEQHKILGYLERVFVEREM